MPPRCRSRLADASFRPPRSPAHAFARLRGGGRIVFRKISWCHRTLSGGWKPHGGSVGTYGRVLAPAYRAPRLLPRPRKGPKPLSRVGPARIGEFGGLAQNPLGAGRFWRRCYRAGRPGGRGAQGDQDREGLPYTYPGARLLQGTSRVSVG